MKLNIRFDRIQEAYLRSEIHFSSFYKSVNINQVIVFRRNLENR